LSNSKSQQKFLENQLLKEKKDGGLYKPIVERKGWVDSSINTRFRVRKEPPKDG